MYPFLTVVCNFLHRNPALLFIRHSFFQNSIRSKNLKKVKKFCIHLKTQFDCFGYTNCKQRGVLVAWALHMSQLVNPLPLILKFSLYYLFLTNMNIVGQTKFLQYKPTLFTLFSLTILFHLVKDNSKVLVFENVFSTETQKFNSKVCGSCVMVFQMLSSPKKLVKFGLTGI